jgi:hypothetical protein
MSNTIFHNISDNCLQNEDVESVELCSKCELGYIPYTLSNFKENNVNYVSKSTCIPFSFPENCKIYDNYNKKCDLCEEGYKLVTTTKEISSSVVSTKT